jgi:uncharacterized protein (TIGR02246 family)
MTDDERTIPNLAETWMTASRAGDTDTVLGLMADDVIFMVSGQPPFGKDAFRAGAETMKNVTMQDSAEIRELKVFDDWAYVRNYIEITITPPGGAPVRRAGYTLSVLRKEPGGNWVLARDANLVM